MTTFSTCASKRDDRYLPGMCLLEGSFAKKWGVSKFQKFCSPIRLQYFRFLCRLQYAVRLEPCLVPKLSRSNYTKGEEEERESGKKTSQRFVQAVHYFSGQLMTCETTHHRSHMHVRTLCNTRGCVSWFNTLFARSPPTYNYSWA